MIKFTHSGNFNNTERFFKKSRNSYLRILEKYGKMGTQVLSSATPQDSGETAKSWDYEIRINKRSLNITWTNSHIVDGTPIAIILQYGHGTRNGGYVQGRDYINPALRPIFDSFCNEIWAEVTR